MKNRFGPLLPGIALLGLLLATPRLEADQFEITIDGDLADWSSVSPSVVDPTGDGSGSGIDFEAVRVADDDLFLFIQIELGTMVQLDEQNNLAFYLDTDMNAATGIPVAGIGAELEWRLGDRNGDFDPAGGGPTSLIFHDAIRFRSAPTVGAAVHELAIGRTTLPNGTQPLFVGPTVRFVFRDESGGGDQVPDAAGGVTYTLDVGGPVGTGTIALDRDLASDLRMVTYNVLNDSPWNGGQGPRFGRQLAAIDPDIVCFQEIYNHSAGEAVALVSSWVPAGAGLGWNGVETNDCKIVSRFPILASWSIGGNVAALIDTTTLLGSSALVICAHLPCCANDAGRQSEIDEILEFLRDAKTAGGTVTLAAGTPWIVTGDLNLVGLPGPLDSLLTGDIDDNVAHGPDFLPDWDGSDLRSVLPRMTELRMGYTWRSDTSSFWPGHLDYFVVSDSVVATPRSYVLYTMEMSAAARAAAGLLPDDSLASDHIPFVLDLRPWGAGGTSFLRSDCNGDGFLDISDGVQGLLALFTALPVGCPDACDGNDDGVFDLADVVVILAHRFSSGLSPPAPFPSCGGDPTPDGLDCSVFPGC